MKAKPTPLCVFSMCNIQLLTSPECQQLLKLHLDSNNWPSDVTSYSSFMTSSRQLVSVCWH